MVTILVFGTFDLLHDGHRYFLRSAKEKGDKLVVVVGRDNNVLQFKNKKPVEDENKRLENISKLDFIDSAFLGRKDHDIYKTLKDIHPDIICLGYDQHSLGIEKVIEKNKLNIKIIRLEAFHAEKFKSSILREKK